MTALAADRATVLRERTTNADPVAATQSIYMGGMVMLNAAGNLVKASADNTLKMRGIATATVVNAAAGTIVESRTKVRGLYANSASGDLIGRANIGASCYVVDDQTVALTSNSGARPVAGKIDDIDGATGQVWVEFL